MIDERGKVFDIFSPPTDQVELMDCLGWTNPIIHSSAMYRKCLAQKVGGYPGDIVWAQDFGLFLALAPVTKFAMIDDHLCQLRVLSESMTRSKKNQIIVAAESLRLFQQAGKLPFLSSRSLKLNRRSCAVANIRLGIANMQNGAIWFGLQGIFRGLMSAPSALWGNGLVRRYFGAKF
jgi:hypothetical protein